MAHSCGTFVSCDTYESQGDAFIHLTDEKVDIKVNDLHILRHLESLTAEPEPRLMVETLAWVLPTCLHPPPSCPWQTSPVLLGTPVLSSERL